jgi:hypothetical protein
MEYEEFRMEFKNQIQNVSHHKLIELMKELRGVTHRRYGGGAPRKYELTRRAFTDEEFARFMGVVESPTHRACFLTMATFGLRKNEAFTLKGRDLEGGRLHIKASKGGFKSFLQLPPALIDLIPVTRPEKLLFGMKEHELVKTFNWYRDIAGLKEVTGRTAPCGVSMRRNKRYRFSLHSFRYYGIQKFWLAHQGITTERRKELTRCYARHRDFKTTRIYLEGLLDDSASIPEVESGVVATANDILGATSLEEDGWITADAR